MRSYNEIEEDLYQMNIFKKTILWFAYLKKTLYVIFHPNEKCHLTLWRKIVLLYDYIYYYKLVDIIKFYEGFGIRI